MQNPTERDLRSPPPSGGLITRAQSDLRNDTAQPPLASGFRAVIEKECVLLSATADALGKARGQHAADVDRILRYQHSRLNANIALLEQRYGAVPNPERFASGSDCRDPQLTPLGIEASVLPALIAGHADLLADIEALIECGSDGQRGELILMEVSRNHQAMARTLTTLLKKEGTRRFPEDHGSDYHGGTRRTEEGPGKGVLARNNPPGN